MKIDRRELHSENAPFSIRETLEPMQNVTFESAEHDEKQFSLSLSTDEGIQIDESDEEASNAERPKLNNWPSLSTATLKTWSFQQKQLEHKYLTPRGIMIALLLPKPTTADVPSKLTRKGP
jgi:hypothetical protein